ncbi:MAG: hypothetical protein WDN29_15090 [Methylovirgula sp.]
MTLIKFILTVLVGTLLGFLITARVLDRGIGFDTARAGPWLGQPKAGTMDIDPYAHAIIARTAELPLGSAEGLSFIAHTDSEDAPLRPECDYTISGTVPADALLDFDDRIAKGIFDFQPAAKIQLHIAGGSFVRQTARSLLTSAARRGLAIGCPSAIPGASP